MSNELLKPISYTEEELRRKEVPVTFAGQEYVLKEADGDAAVRYRNACLACTTMGPDGRPQTVRNLANVEPFLVHLCLFYKANNKNVSEATIRAWPNWLQKELYQRARDISHLTEDTSESEQFGKALSREDSPIRLEVVREFIDSLPVAEFRALQALVKPTEEEIAKNSQNGTMGGSGSSTT